MPWWPRARGRSRALAETVYHLELRQFPHNTYRFNLAAEELRATVLDAWARGQWVELGERKWSPHQAKLRVLEGPPIPVEQLSMGRGWRAASRQGREVTAELLAAADREASQTQEPRPGATADLVADSLGLELLARIGDDQAPLRRAWELAKTQHPGARASESLAIAERAVDSLLRARLIVLLGCASSDGTSRPLREEEAGRMLGAIEGWAGEGEAETAQVWIRRA
jgi:hypothetical protein